ncbi:hypothetical protein C435_15127 [Haloarcula marismortui ATCC 33799]|uniref:Uncharacterized protein n=2 Tax=Haloarcula marismortui TaxID=2238 RepID=M0K3Y0_9EURY|nr:hypothetical protein C435_15127 [Haloarcula californiae ATCC 33799]
MEYLARETRLNGDDSMISNTTDPESTTTAVVTIRVPCGADRDLVADAEKRLSRPETIDDVTINELDSVEPQLSATQITVEITVQWPTANSEEEIRDRFADVSGLESIIQIREEEDVA